MTGYPGCDHQEEATFADLVGQLVSVFIAGIVWLVCVYFMVHWLLAPPGFLQALGCQPIILNVRVVTDTGSDEPQPSQFLDAGNQVRKARGVTTLRQKPVADHHVHPLVAHPDLNQASASASNVKDESVVVGKSVAPPLEKHPYQPGNEPQKPQ